MPYVLRIATPDSRDLVVAALRSAADQRTRVATKAAREVAATKAGGRDVRAQAVKVTMLLAEAADLGALADELAAATEVAVMTVEADGSITTAAIPDPTVPAPTLTEEAVAQLEATTPAADTPPEDVDTAPDVDDDGTSQEAQRLAALAGLTAAVIDPDAPDVDTGSIGEDEPDTPEDIQL